VKCLVVVEANLLYYCYFSRFCIYFNAVISVVGISLCFFKIGAFVIDKRPTPAKFFLKNTSFRNFASCKLHYKSHQHSKHHQCSMKAFKVL